jgi:hypothetical protein
VPTDEEIIERARQADVKDIAAQLLDHASGDKFACPVCPSSDALQVRDDHAVCYSARHPGGGEAVMDGIELVQEAASMGFVAAVEWITGDRLDQSSGRSRKRKRHKQSDRTWEGKSKGGGLEPTTVLLKAMLKRLDLSDRAIDYLKGRGIPEGLARQVGIVDCSHEYWGALAHKGAKEWDMVKASGIASGKEDGSVHPYYRHFLCFPYWRAPLFHYDNHNSGDMLHECGTLETVRFRTTVHGEQPKMMSLRGEGPTGSAVPYLAESQAAAHANEWPLFVVEGELDALSIVACGWPAVASYSANVWRNCWSKTWAQSNIPKIVVVAEGDQGGDTFADTVKASAEEVCGTSWTSRHISRLKLPDGKDVNDLRMDGVLSDRIEGVISSLLESGAL